MNQLINIIIAIIVSVGAIFIISVIAEAAARNESNEGKSFILFIFSKSMLVYLFIVPFPICFAHIAIDYILHCVLKLFKITKPFVKDTSAWYSICVYYFLLCFVVAFVVGYMHYVNKSYKNSD